MKCFPFFYNSFLFLYQIQVRAELHTHTQLSNYGEEELVKNNQKMFNKMSYGCKTMANARAVKFLSLLLSCINDVLYKNITFCVQPLQPLTSDLNIRLLAHAWKWLLWNTLKLNNAKILPFRDLSV